MVVFYFSKIITSIPHRDEYMNHTKIPKSNTNHQKIPL
nr:MAG TPA: hypothetical protein [Caudoviricetes sp.]